jgi:hypothetical protein
MWAAYKGRIKSLMLLLKAGVDVDAIDEVLVYRCMCLVFLDCVAFEILQCDLSNSV